MTKIKVTIYSVFGSVIWESEKETLKEAVVEKNNRDANLHDADLYGANLRDANLRDANLYGANLHDADLRGANLRGADLRDANLYGADLYGANLHDADLRGANLRGANLRGANLRGANLHDADLYGANLRGANLYGANLHDADLYGANLHDADLRDANLRDANLYGANLHDADLRGANLRGADLRDANLYGAYLYKLPVDFINQCSRDILFILSCLKSEIPYLKRMLIEGKVDGSVYEGDCVCLIGTLAHGKDNKKVCERIPFYEKGTHNMGEAWFLNIREGDTPENNEFAAHVLKLIEMVETGKMYTITYDEPALSVLGKK